MHTHGTHTCTHTAMCMHTCDHACVHTCLCAQRTHMYARHELAHMMHTHIHTHAYVCTCSAHTCIHTPMHTCIHIFIYTYHRYVKYCHLGSVPLILSQHFIGFIWVFSLSRFLPSLREIKKEIKILILKVFTYLTSSSESKESWGNVVLMTLMLWDPCWPFSCVDSFPSPFPSLGGGGGVLPPLS